MVPLAILLFFVISSAFTSSFDSLLFNISMIAMFCMPLYFFIIFNIWFKVRRVKKTFSKDILIGLSWKNFDKLYLLSYSEDKALKSFKSEEIIRDLDAFYLKNIKTPYFRHRPITFIEVILFLLGGFIIYPVIFLFQRERSRDVKIGVKHGELGVAKFVTIFSLGLYWWFLRFLAKECPICHCRNSIDVIDQDILSSENKIENYQENVVTEHKDNLGKTIGTSHTPTTKYRVKTIVIKDVYYQCLNCNGYKDVKKETEVNY